MWLKDDSDVMIVPCKGVPSEGDMRSMVSQWAKGNGNASASLQQLQLL